MSWKTLIAGALLAVVGGVVIRWQLHRELLDVCKGLEIVNYREGWIAGRQGT